MSGRPCGRSTGASSATAERCSAVGLALLDQSAVVDFYADHGVALSDVPYWQLSWCVDDEPTSVVSEDPWRLSVALTCEEDVLHVVVDEDLSVVETRRE